MCQNKESVPFNSCIQFLSYSDRRFWFQCWLPAKNTRGSGHQGGMTCYFWFPITTSHTICLSEYNYCCVHEYIQDGWKASTKEILSTTSPFQPDFWSQSRIVRFLYWVGPMPVKSHFFGFPLIWFDVTTYIWSTSHYFDMLYLCVPIPRSGVLRKWWTCDLCSMRNDFSVCAWTKGEAVTNIVTIDL